MATFTTHPDHPAKFDDFEISALDGQYLYLSTPTTHRVGPFALDIGTDILRRALAENPLNYFRMLNSFARLTNGGLKCERHVVDELERKAKARRGTKPGKKGVSPKSLKEMEDKLKLM